MEDLITKVAAMCGSTDPDTILGKLAAWKGASEQLATTQAKLADIEAREAKAREATTRESLVSEALTARKITPDEAAKIRSGAGFLGALPTDALRAMLAERGAIVSAPGAGPRQPSEPPAGDDEVKLNDEEKRQAKAMGVSEADMLTTKKRHLGLAA